MYLNLTIQSQNEQVGSKPVSYTEPTTYTAHLCELNQEITRKQRHGGGTQRATNADRGDLLLTTASPDRVGRIVSSIFSSLFRGIYPPSSTGELVSISEMCQPLCTRAFPKKRMLSSRGYRDYHLFETETSRHP